MFRPARFARSTSHCISWTDLTGTTSYTDVGLRPEWTSFRVVPKGRGSLQEQPQGNNAATPVSFKNCLRVIILSSHHSLCQPHDPKPYPGANLSTPSCLSTQRLLRFL